MPSSISIDGQISPVYAPASSQWTFCAATAISVPARSCTATARETYGGQTTTSTPPRSRSRRAVQNAADDGVGICGGDGFGHGLGAARESRPLEDAHRTVPEDRLRAGDLVGEACARLRTDVEAEPAVRDCVVRRHLRLGVRLEGRGGDDVARQDDRKLERTLVPQLLGHLAADQNRVGARAQVAEDADLVVDLRAARDEDERTLD